MGRIGLPELFIILFIVVLIFGANRLPQLATGIGKSAIWNDGLEEARRRGVRVLDCRPSGSDASLSFVALGDLLDAEAEPSFEALPDPQR